MNEPRMEVIVTEVPTSVDVTDAQPHTEVIVHEVTQAVAGEGEHFEVVIHETRFEVVEERPNFQVLISEPQVEVVSVGIQGPPGPVGPVGPPGGLTAATAPLQVTGATVSLAPGTAEGQGYIWNGASYVTKSVIPAGSGTIPYTTTQGLGGDAPNFRYEPTEQALYVTRLNNTSLDGGNF